MNIALFTDDFYPNLGGISDVLLNLYKQFDEQDETLFLFNPYTKGKNLFDTLKVSDVGLREFSSLIRKKNFYAYILLSLWSILQDKKIPFHHRIKLILYLFINPKTFLLVIRDIINLYPMLKNIKIDLVVAGNSGRMLSLCFIISRILKTKLISIGYGNDFLISNPFSLKSFYFKNTDKIVVITHQTKELIKKVHHLNENKIEVIYVGIDINTLNVKKTKSELRKEFNISNDDFVILSVGRHVPRKNFQLVIRALNEINKIYLNPLNKPNLNPFEIKYYLIGKGKQTKDLKQLTKDLNLEDQVVFLGRCDIDTRNKYYKIADLFVMPSITKKDDIEGFGIVFLEANYFKVPVIGSATGGMSEAIVNKETGFLIEQNDVRDLVRKILFLCNNESVRKKMGKNGFNRVINGFQWENIIKSYIQLIKKLK